MSTYNIEMNSYNGTSYDQLYPKTLLENVSDWNNSIYSKEELDSTISNIQNNITSLNNKKFSQLVSTRISISAPGTNGTVRLVNNINTYKFLLFEFDGTEQMGNYFNFTIFDDIVLRLNYTRTNMYLVVIANNLIGVTDVLNSAGSQGLMYTSVNLNTKQIKYSITTNERETDKTWIIYGY